jgi:hypothetical protein
VPDDESRLVPFEPEPTLAPHTNGSHLKRRGRVLGGITFGFLLGSLLATSLVPRLQWLNLSTIGWWGRPVVAAVGAGIIIGFFRHDDLRAGMIGGAIGGLLALWGVYAIVRLSVHILFVDRSVTRVVAGDLLRLAAYGVPAGAAGAAAGWGARTVIGRAAAGR